MNNIVFCININAVLLDNTEVINGSGFIINKKRVYKNVDGEILTGTKKIKTIKSCLMVVSPILLPYINNLEND